MRIASTLLLWLLLPAAVFGQKLPGVALLGDAMVTGDQVTLADLLPASAPSPLRKEAERVTLGDAPQPGAFRLFPAAMLRDRLLEEDLGNAISVKGDTTVSKKVRFIGWHDIEPAVVGEFDARHLPRPTEIEMNLPVAAPEGPVAFKVRNLRYDVAQKCYELSVVGNFPSARPFLVRVPSNVGPNEGPGAAMAAKAGKTARVTARPDIRRGAHSVLRVAGQGFTATVPVIVLEDAVTGASVRVEDPSNHRIYQAELTASGLDVTYR